MFLILKIASTLANVDAIKPMKYVERVIEYLAYITLYFLLNKFVATTSSIAIAGILLACSTAFGHVSQLLNSTK